jgi:adenylate cyclase class IV
MRTEFQIKFGGELPAEKILSLGGEVLGRCSQQKDTYLAGGNTRRVREEGGAFLFAEKGHARHVGVRVRQVSDREIGENEARRLVRESGILAIVAKSRTIYRLNGQIVAVDEVEYLGSFVELSASSEEELKLLAKLLGLAPGSLVKESYLELMLQAGQPAWLKTVLSLHEKVGELSFGITSGVMTTTGMLLGTAVASGGSAKAAIIAVAMIGLTDSWSDAYGIYNAKIGERGVSAGQAMRHASGTLIGKMAMPMTFIVPLLVAPMRTAMVFDLCWAMLVLALLSAEQAIVLQESVIRRILKNVWFGAFLVAFATFGGLFIEKLLSR